VASTLNLFRHGAVGFIDWLGRAKHFPQLMEYLISPEKVTVAVQSLYLDRLERMRKISASDLVDLAVEIRDINSATLNEPEPRLTDIGREPDEPHTAPKQFLNNRTTPGRKTPIQSDPRVSAAQLANEIRRISIPQFLEFRMWPSAREALEVVVREAVVARQESAELRLSRRWDAREQEDHPQLRLTRQK
jgi:hypothetical protein